MKHATINETINPNQVDMVNLFDVNEGEWGDVSKSLTPNQTQNKVDEIKAVLHSNILFIDGVVDAGTTEIKLNKTFGFIAKKSILDIYEQVGGDFVKGNYIGLVDGKTITLPIVANDFLIKGFLVGE